MTRETRVPKAKISGLQGAIVKQFCKRLLGRVPEPLGVAWHNPRVLRTYLTIGSRTKKWNSADRTLKSLAHMTVATQVGCSWCLDFGYFQAHNEGLDLDKAREVPRWRESRVFSPQERDVMEYAEAMTQTPPAVTDEMSERLLDLLGAAALVELTAVVGGANLASRNNVALGIKAQGLAASCGLEPLAAPAAHAPTAPATSPA
jgi:AhpD family alkylhydroperoxidase